MNLIQKTIRKVVPTSWLRKIRKTQSKLALTYRWKTLLTRLLPGGLGYSKTLRQQHDPNFNPETDLHPVRQKHHGDSGWQAEDNQGIIRRDYADYDEYVEHQKQKLDEIAKLKGGFAPEVLAGYRQTFFNRFKYLSNYLNRQAVIVCAGARQGTEVEVLRDMGYKNAIGIDLNPGANNPYVKVGDFMHMDYEDESVDLIYTNCIDHAFDLDQFFAEHARVIKSNGYVL
ncbi:hypothetical protein MASR2M15_10790 [Anaerolineales bacterium]